MAIKCCNGCVPPKRSPTCHGSCPDYIREKAENDARLEDDFRKRSIAAGLNNQTERAVRRASRRKRKRGKDYES